LFADIQNENKSSKKEMYDNYRFEFIFEILKRAISNQSFSLKREKKSNSDKELRLRAQSQIF